MHLKDGLPWSIPVTLSVDDDGAHRLGGAAAVALTAGEGGEALGVLRVSEIYPRDKAKEAISVYRTDDPEHPGVAAVNAAGDKCVAGELQVIALPPHDDFLQYRLTPARDAGGVRRAGLEDHRRVPDAQPDPPRARVHPEVRARDRRRAARAPARRRHEGRRRPRGRAHALLRGAVRGLLPEGPRDGERVPRPRCATPARARPSGTRSAARTTAAPTSSSAATTPGVGSYYGTYDAQEIFKEFAPGELGHPDAELRALVLVQPL